jgi:hypothetical protein
MVNPPNEVLLNMQVELHENEEVMVSPPLLGNNKKEPFVWPTDRLGHTLTGSLSFIILFSMVCYALSVSNTAEVQAACGKQLWQFVLAHLVMPIGLFIIIIFGTVGVMGCCIGFSDQDEAFLPIVFAFIGAVMLLSYSSLFLGFGVPIVNAAMNAEGCTAALSGVSFTNSPLLIIMCWIYLALDGLVLLCVALAILFGCCFAFAPTTP